MTQQNKANRHGVWIFAFCLSIYLMTMGGHLYSADNEIKGFIAESIVERHSVALPEVQMMYMVPGRDGLSYAYFPIGSSLTMVPFYYIGNLISEAIPSVPRSLILEFCYATINSIVTALTCFFLFLICCRLKYSIRTATATTLIYGFCTIAWPYAQTAWSEPQAILCVLVGFYATLRYFQGYDAKLLWILLAGFSMGYSFTTKLEMGLYAVLLGGFILLYMIRKKKSWQRICIVGLIYGVPLAIFGFLNLYYNYLRFDNWLNFGQNITSVQTQMVQTNPFTDSLEGFVVGIYQHLFSTGKGILIFSPPIIMFYWATKAFWKAHRLEAIFCLSAFIILFVIAGTSWHMTFMSWGERYFVSITPFMILPLSELLEDIIDYSSTFMKKSIITLAALGLCVQILGVSVNFQTTSDKLFQAGDKFDIQMLSYDPEYSPVLLNFKEFISHISDTWKLFAYGPDQFTSVQQPSASSLTINDFDQKSYRDLIRYHTFDFWFLYMYFVKFPPVMILIPLCLLMALAFISGRKLYSIY